MEMSGEVHLLASRRQVWDALNDPAVMKASIPGCDALEKTSDTEFTARVTARVGPVKAKFAGAVTLSNIDPPNGYTITGEGKGGAAGFARGGADVRLTDDGNGTLLSYTVNAAVGGKLAQIGSRLIDSTARKMADRFFAGLAEQLGGVADAGPAVGAAPAETDAPAAPEPSGAATRRIGPALWIPALIVIVILALLYYAAS